MKTLIDAIKEIESKDFRTVNDTGADSNAMLILNRFRKMADLPAISLKDLPAYSDGEYRMPVNSKLLANAGNTPVFHNRVVLEKNGFEFIQSFAAMPSYPEMTRVAKNRNVSLGQITAFRFEDASWGAFFVKNADEVKGIL